MNLNQVTVPSLNVKKAVEFYQQLGLKLIVENYPSYARFECPEGLSTVSMSYGLKGYLHRKKYRLVKINTFSIKDIGAKVMQRSARVH